MDINSVITEREYNSIRELPYDQLCVYIRRLVKLSVEEALKSLPVIFSHLSTHAATLKEISDEFYKNNPDLSNERSLMVSSLEKVEGENPDLSYEELLSKAARLARSKISAKKLLSNSSGRDNLDRYDKRLNKL